MENKLTDEARKIKENTNYFNVVTYNRKTLIESFSKLKNNNIKILTDEEKIEKKKEHDDLESQCTKYRDEKVNLEGSLKDETKAAELINYYLKNYFGRNDLELKVDKDKKIKFSIYRNSELALNLSEGECSLISFSYFLATIKDYEESDNLILWIDDPISSLDNNQIFFTFGAIDKIIIEHKYNQIFISTHNLDFLIEKIYKSIILIIWY